MFLFGIKMKFIIIVPLNSTNFELFINDWTLHILFWRVYMSPTMHIYTCIRLLRELPQIILINSNEYFNENLMNPERIVYYFSCRDFYHT
jgi:hypothetical protein